MGIKCMYYHVAVYQYLLCNFSCEVPVTSVRLWHSLVVHKICCRQVYHPQVKMLAIHNCAHVSLAL